MFAMVMLSSGDPWKREVKDVLGLTRAPIDSKKAIYRDPETANGCVGLGMMVRSAGSQV